MAKASVAAPEKTSTLALRAEDEINLAECYVEYAETFLSEMWQYAGLGDSLTKRIAAITGILLIAKGHIAEARNAAGAIRGHVEVRNGH